jgi:protein O-mannosyl-transferase
VHPMHCETVNWASDLKDLLYSFFYLASLMFYIKYLKSEVGSKRSEIKTSNLIYYSKSKSQKSKFYIISLLLFVCSCFSKPAAVTLPVVLLITDYYTNSSKFKAQSLKYWMDKIPFFLLSIIFGIINIYSQASNIYSGSVVDSYFDLSKYNIADRICFPIYNLSYYLISSIIPYKLSAIHPYPEIGYSVSGIGYWVNLPIEYYIYPLIIVIGIGLRLGLKFKHKLQETRYKIDNLRYLIFGMLFFIINITLVLQIVPVGSSIVSERYSYLSYFGLFFIISLELNEFKRISRIRQTYFNIVLVLFILIFSFVSHERNKVWANNFSLYNDVLSKYPESDVAYENRGSAKINEHDNYGAIQDFNKAIELNPKYAKAFYNRGLAKNELHEQEGALQDYSKAIEVNPQYADAYNNRGHLKFELGDNKGSINDYDKAIEINPQHAVALNNRGAAKGQINDFKGAILDFNKAIKINPQYIVAYYNRGNAKIYLGDKAGAFSDWNKAGEQGINEAYEMIKRYCN